MCKTDITQHQLSGCLYLCGKLEIGCRVWSNWRKISFSLSVFSQRYSCQHDIDLLEGWRFILAGLDLESIQWQFTVYLDCLFVCSFFLRLARFLSVVSFRLGRAWSGVTDLSPPLAVCFNSSMICRKCFFLFCAPAKKSLKVEVLKARWTNRPTDG